MTRVLTCRITKRNSITQKSRRMLMQLRRHLLTCRRHHRPEQNLRISQTLCQITITSGRYVFTSLCKVAENCCNLLFSLQWKSGSVEYWENTVSVNLTWNQQQFEFQVVRTALLTLLCSTAIMCFDFTPVVAAEYSKVNFQSLSSPRSHWLHYGSTWSALAAVVSAKWRHVQ